MKSLAQELEARLAELDARGLGRQLSEGAGLDFSSNDYLGLSKNPKLAEGVRRRLETGAVGAPASRLLRGQTRAHRELEERLAAWKGMERALLFPSGYQANLALLTTLVGPGDRVLSDRLNHASLIDGLRLAGCEKVIFDHLDTGFIEQELARPWPRGRTFLVTESLFSMEGDLAPLERYGELAAAHGAELVVDDAHATGLYGDERGSGWVEACRIEKRVTAVVSTFGKALGIGGACITAPAVVIEYLIQRARPFIFTTAMPPVVVAAIDAALDVVKAEPERRRRVFTLARRLRGRLRELGLDTRGEDGPLVPVIVGENRRAVETAEALQARGLDVRAVRPPTVPEGTARLRISIHADHTEAQIDALGDELAEALGEVVSRGALVEEAVG